MSETRPISDADNPLAAITFQSEDSMVPRTSRRKVSIGRRMSSTLGTESMSKRIQWNGSGRTTRWRSPPEAESRKKATESPSRSFLWSQIPTEAWAARWICGARNPREARIFPRDDPGLHGGFDHFEARQGHAVLGRDGGLGRFGRYGRGLLLLAREKQDPGAQGDQRHSVGNHHRNKITAPMSNLHRGIVPSTPKLRPYQSATHRTNQVREYRIRP
jgi:hypothetical protein